MEKVTLVDQYVELVRPQGWEESLVRWSFITYVSACLARKVWLEEGTEYIYPNIYVMFVGPPSAKKTTVAKAPKHLFAYTQANPPKFSSEQMSPAAWFKDLEDSYKEGGSNFEQSPLYMLIGEFNTLLNDIGGGSPMDLLLSFYDFRRPGEAFVKRTIKDGKQNCINPAVTILGCTTPAGLRSSKMIQFDSQGFVSRFITVAHPKFVRGVAKRPLISEAKRKPFIEEMDRISMMWGHFRMSEQADARYEQIFNEVNDQQEAHTGTGPFAEYLARKSVQIKKVAILFAAMRSNEQIIRVEDIDEAYRHISATEANFHYAFSPMVKYKDPGTAQQILEQFYYKPIMSASELHERLYAAGTVLSINGDTKGIMDSLVTSGKLKLIRKDGAVFYEKA